MATNPGEAGTQRNDTSAYRATPSDPTATSNSDAVRAIGRHVWRYVVLPRAFERCITETTSTTEEYARALYQIERRKIVHRLSPAHGYQKRHESPLPDPGAFDPWAISDDELVKSTSCIARCPACEGSKKTVCSNCYGSGRVACGYCGGGGRVQGQKGLRNCPSCNGRGDARCDFCSRGRVDCATCDTAGRVEAWLEIMRVPVSQVRGHPEGPGAQVHVHRAEPEDFDAGPEDWPHRLVSDTGVQAPGSVKLPSQLAPELDAWSDRVRSMRVQRFEAAVHRFSYELPTGRGVLVLSGSPAAFAPESNWKPLVLRRWGLAAVWAVMGIAAIWIAGSYAGQHEWYRTYGATEAIGWLAFAFWIAGTVAAAALAVPRRTWAPPTTWAPLGVAGVLLSVVGVYAGTGPSKHEAELAVSASEVHRARLTAEALVDLGTDREGGHAILDELQLRELAELPTLRAKVYAAQRPWRLPENARRAEEHVVGYARDHMAEMASSCQDALFDEIASLVQPFDPAYAKSVASSAALCRVKRCARERNCDCVATNLDSAKHALEKEQEGAKKLAYHTFAAAFQEERTKAAEAKAVRDRAGHLRQAKIFGACTHRLGGDVDPAVLDKIGHDLEADDKVIKVEDERLAREAEAKRTQEEARAKAEQARAEAEERRLAAIEAAREASRRVKCCDGTLSPSCLCSRASMRGCCSRHGGVCGCE